MRVFMLGWEFPPFISGGLGTACYGLTKALGRRDIGVTFVLPKAIGAEYSSHVRLLSPQTPRAAMGDRAPGSVASTYKVDAGSDEASFKHVTFKAVPSRITSPYVSGRPAGQTNGAHVPGGQPIGVLGVGQTGGPGAAGDTAAGGGS